MSVRVGTNTESRIQQSFNLLGLWWFFFVVVCFFLFLFAPCDVVIFLHGKYAVHHQMDGMADYSFYLEEITLKVVILITYVSLYLEKCFLHNLNNSNTLLNISSKLKAQGWQRNNQYTQLEFYEGVWKNVLIKTNICQILFPAFHYFKSTSQSMKFAHQDSNSNYVFESHPNLSFQRAPTKSKRMSFYENQVLQSSRMQYCRAPNNSMLVLKV